MNRRQILCVGVAVMLTAGLVAGCGSSKSSSSSSGSTGGGSYGSYGSPSSTSTPASTPAPAAAGGGMAVVMKNIAFSPPVVRAKVGQVVTWTNDDTVAHTVKAVKGENFKSPGAIAPGAKYAYKIDHASTISYMCTIHPNMTGTIIATK
jgi:plastocyanin